MHSSTVIKRVTDEVTCWGGHRRVLRRTDSVRIGMEVVAVKATIIITVEAPRCVQQSAIEEECGSVVERACENDGGSNASSVDGWLQSKRQRGQEEPEDDVQQQTDPVHKG